MNETLALTKYVWTRYRIFLSILILMLFLSGMLTTVLSIMNAPRWLCGTAVGSGYIAVLFALTGSIVLFGFSRQSGLLDPKSGYDGWLMRLPISNCKLAAIPAGLITCWIMTIWTGTAVVCRLVGGPSVPIISQSIGMSSCAMIACSLGWMPFRAVWLRVVLIIIALPLLYFVGMGAMVVSFECPAWMPWAVAGIVTCYIASIAFAIYSVKLARVSSFQQTKFATAPPASKPALAIVSRSFASWPDALNWHDRSLSRGAKLLQVPTMFFIIGILIWILPLSTATAIFTMVIVASLVGWVVSTRFEPTVWGALSSLPSYLIASPLPSRTIAFTRLRSYATEYIGVMFIMTLMWLSCFAWQSNRAAASGWWSSVVATGVSQSAPLRIIAAIYLAILVTMLGSSLRHVCVQLRGRHVIVLWFTAACCLVLFSPVIGFLT